MQNYVNHAALAMHVRPHVESALSALHDLKVLLKYSTPHGNVSGLTGNHNMGRYHSTVYRLETEAMVQCAAAAGLLRTDESRCGGATHALARYLDKGLLPQVGDLLLCDRDEFRIYAPQVLANIFGDDWHPARKQAA